MKIDILTLFPEMFSPLEHSIVGKAREKGLLEINYHNFRENAEKARHVDDEPYGGGQGMLLRAQPIFDAFDAIEKKNPRVILLDPAGRTFDQRYAEELAQEEELIFICGHYEGYDERIKSLVTDEISLGDYVLTGGELAAMTMIDATVRLIPEVIGKESSHQDDSFSSGLLEYPQYTRPYEYRGMTVPDVLMSGHHENIRQWRLYQSLKKTLERRPDLLEKYDFDDIIVSLKASEIETMIESYESFADLSNYPLHLGVTEAGTLRGGTVKSAMGIGHLLLNGIGDTIRVSLTADPVEEIPVAKMILQNIGYKFGAVVVSCPTCARTNIDIINMANKVEEATKDIKKDIKIAVMGCIVNGPGEAKDADIGIAGGNGEALFFANGKSIKKVKEEDIVTELLRMIDEF